MAALSDPTRLLHYRTVLSLWKYECYIHLKRASAERLYAEFEGLTIRELGRLMCEYEAAGGFIDEVEEKRPEYRGQFRFHHDLRFQLPGGRRVYLETILEMGPEPEDSMILVVNAHDQ